jgi:hypothetical protein
MAGAPERKSGWKIEDEKWQTHPVRAWISTSILHPPSSIIALNAIA